MGMSACTFASTWSNATHAPRLANDIDDTRPGSTGPGIVSRSIRHSFADRKRQRCRPDTVGPCSFEQTFAVTT